MRFVRMAGRPLQASLIFLMIGWAIAVHLAMILSVPDPIFAQDSGSYLSPAMDFLYGKPFSVYSSRTPFYSLFLYLTLRTTQHFVGVLVIQHGLALATGCVAGLLYYRHIRKSPLGAVLVFSLTASLPLPVIYAHYILTENLFTLLLLASVWLILISTGKCRDRWWSLTGIVIALAILTRPAGRSLLAVLALIPWLSAPTRMAWRRWVWGVGSSLAVLALYASWNYSRQGFFGLDQMGNTALFCSSARYLDPAAIQDDRLRAILAPIYMKYEKKMRSGDWVYGSEDGPRRKISEHYPPDQQNKIFGDLASLAIRRHPWQFFFDRLALLEVFFTKYSEVPRYFIIPETSYYVYQGLTLYESIATPYPMAWRYLHYGPLEAKTYFDRMRMVPTGRPSGHLPFVPRSDGDLVYHFYKVLPWWQPVAILINQMRWLSLIALASALVLVRDEKTRYAVIVVCLVIGFHAAISVMAAWQDSRFVVPVLPLYYLLSMGGIQLALSWVAVRFTASLRRWRSMA